MTSRPHIKIEIVPVSKLDPSNLSANQTVHPKAYSSQQAMFGLMSAIQSGGPIRAARISAAKISKGVFGYRVVDYLIRLRKLDNVPTSVPQIGGRKGVVHRDFNVAEKELNAYCRETGRIPMTVLGELSSADAAYVMSLYKQTFISEEVIE